MPEEQPTPEPKRIQFRQTEGLTAQVLIDGKDVSNFVSRFTFDQSRNGEIPLVFLELPAMRSLEDLDVTGIVHVRETVTEDPADAVLRFLENVDPAELDRCVIAALELGGPTTYGEATLEVFRGWARGD